MAINVQNDWLVTFAVRTVSYGPVNKPIRAHVLCQPYNNTLYYYIILLSPGQTDLQVDTGHCKFLTYVQPAFRLAMHFRWLWSSSNRTQVDASFLLFGHQTQVNTNWLQVICTCVKFTTLCDSRELANRLANPFGHPLRVRAQVLVLQTCVDLHWLCERLYYFQ